MTTRRILVRSGKAPHETTSVEAAHARKAQGVFAGNVGNYLFTDAVYRALRTPVTEVVSDGLTTERSGSSDAHVQRLDDEFDALVLPMANSFRESWTGPLDRLSSIVERLTIPVVVAGVGAQLPITGDPTAASPKLNTSVTRFVRAVLEKSAAVGVRGEHTKNYLRHLGFPDDAIDVIGCPSMYDNGPSPSVTKTTPALATDAPLAINITPSVPGMPAILDRHHARYPDLTYIPQENDELALLLWGRPANRIPDGLPKSVEHVMYREDKIRFFVEAPPWIEFLSTRRFAFGNRIHGNIAAIMAGTPAVLFAHDSRTVELARFHGLPHRLMSEVTGDVDAAELYEQADFSDLNRLRPVNFATWVAFLEKNGLTHIHQDGMADPAYAAQLARTRFNPPVRPLTSATVADLASRLRWLWQSTDQDQYRPEGAYRPGVSTPGDSPARAVSSIAREALETARKALDGAQQAAEEVATAQGEAQRTALRRTEELRAEVAELRTTQKQLQARVDQQAERLDHLDQPFEKRARKAFGRRARRLIGRD